MLRSGAKQREGRALMVGVKQGGQAYGMRMLDGGANHCKEEALTVGAKQG